ncbi:MAG: DUF2279 domain-containing protein [candidate division KSB1 bacterium]
MHKKAVRRARQERHRFTQRRRRMGKYPRFVARHASPVFARRLKPSAARALVLPFQPSHERLRREKTILPWLLVLALTFPTALNHYYITRPRALALREEGHGFLPFHEVRPSAPVALPYPAEEGDLNLRQLDASLAPRARSSELTSVPAHEPLGLDTIPLALFEEEAFAPPRGVQWERLIAVQAVTLGVGVYGLNYMNGVFGGIAQPFEVGNDWSKDHFMHFDELLHLQGAYRITQAVSGVYQWAGVKPRHADWIGAGTAAALMTTMEYIDGRRKNDEASYSDFAANFLGAGLALVKPRMRALQDFDLRLSYRTLSDPFDRKRMKRYDRMTHWLTYDLQRRWKLPLHVGLGYSVHRAGTPRAKAEYFFGVGVSPQALVKNVFPSAAQPLRWLELYHFGNQVPINEAGTTRKGRPHGK